jgi:hypothetical protein
VSAFVSKIDVNDSRVRFIIHSGDGGSETFGPRPMARSQPLRARH